MMGDPTSKNQREGWRCGDKESSGRTTIVVIKEVVQGSSDSSERAVVTAALTPIHAFLRNANVNGFEIVLEGS
jgi:hypothetical protein